MKSGYLSEYFLGVASKILSAVEIDSRTSNQHEFNGVTPLQLIFGTERATYNTTFMLANECDGELLIEEGSLTWYDAREKARVQRGINRSEYRLYYKSDLISNHAKPGDLLFIAKLKIENKVLCILAESGSRIAEQLLWLFGKPPLLEGKFWVNDNLDDDLYRVEFISRTILEAIGVEVQVNIEDELPKMIRRFGNDFPSTVLFSEYARQESRLGYDPDILADELLMTWFETEDTLFRTFEAHQVNERLCKRQITNIDEFLGYAKSVINRRKSRAGHALENHVQYYLGKRGICFSRNPITENKSRPDFLFPGIQEYRDGSFPEDKLFMLGVKTTCKDRWRQVLAEADRIKRKHILTLDANLSGFQREEMSNRQVTLVIPDKILQVYGHALDGTQNFASFVEIIEKSQNRREGYK